MKKYAFNRWASDKMSLKRELPDVRHSTCRTIEYDKDLPSVSLSPSLSASVVVSPEMELGVQFLSDFYLLSNCRITAGLGSF